MAAASPRILNVNVGILGHVDSGKTSLVAALSTRLSTAALDKHPQSKERGITLDLGFSSFTVPIHDHLKHLPYDILQFTLVDCPGHASLIRTIIGGVQIIDIMLLVIDVTKGLQAQTAECLVVGEVVCNTLVVALNKVDLLPPDEQQKQIKRAAKRLNQTLQITKFANAPMVPVSAKPGGEGGSGAAEGLELLTSCLASQVPATVRAPRPGALLFAVDHCFPVKGQGTVLTGTVLQGSLRVGEMIELPELRSQHKVKSMQMFKVPVTRAQQGDRVGVCVTQLDSSLVERGLVCAPGSVPTFSAAVARVEKIRFYAGEVRSKSKMHMSVGHITVMATLTFFGLPNDQGLSRDAALQESQTYLRHLASKQEAFDFSRDYLTQQQLYGMEGRPGAVSVASEAQSSSAGAVSEDESPPHFGPQWALIKFDHPVTVPQDSVVIGSRFDMDVNGESCRLALYGRLLATIDPVKVQDMARLRIYKEKVRSGIVERVQPDGMRIICRNLFKKESDISLFTGLKVTTATGQVGTIEGTFGKSGKVVVVLTHSLYAAAQQLVGTSITMKCKKYIYATDKRMVIQ